jgi:hypothetical protein
MQAAVHCELSNVILDMYLNNATEKLLSAEDLSTALVECIILFFHAIIIM